MSTTIGELTVIVTTRQAVAKTAARTRIFSSRGDNTPLFVWGHRVAADADGNQQQKGNNRGKLPPLPSKTIIPCCVAAFQNQLSIKASYAPTGVGAPPLRVGGRRFLRGC
jgi:hypothetical protein